MLHVLTVHWKDARWIDVQLRYLQRFIQSPYKVYAFLNDVPGDHASRFFHVSSEPIKSHALKLNLLADMACLHARSDEDWLVFLDGDAFPIAPLDAFLEEIGNHFPLIAIQRLENLGDPQPHPSFCMTRVGFWKEIKGDWHVGHRWKNAEGFSVTDVGANLLKLLNDRNLSWNPLTRTNRVNRHPLWFGIYGDLIYHHGAGFRNGSCRLDVVQFARSWEKPILNYFQALPDRGRYKRLKRMNLVKKLVERRFMPRNRQLEAEMWQAIQTDPDFFRALQ